MAVAKPAPMQEGLRLVMPPDRHIPINFQEIYAIVRGSMSISQRQKYEELCQLIESLYAQEFMTLRRNLKANFLRFSTGAKDQPLPTRVGKPLPTKAELDASEQKLVSDLIQLMAASRFHIVTKEEWATALQERFLFNLPVAVNWAYFDGTMLPAFWASNAERRRLRSALPDSADRVLVFHRGVSVAEDSGLYISEKVDLLVDYLVVWPFNQARAWLGAKTGALAARLRLRLGKVAAPAEADKGRPLSATRGKSPFASDMAGLAPDAPGAGDAPAVGGGIDGPGGGEEGATHKAAKVVERRSLRRLMPNTWAIIKALPRTLKLQEPQFKEVVVVYRTSGTGRTSGRKSKVPARARSTTERLRDILRRRNIHVKCFHDIPMADIEVIFPDKKVYLKTVSLINMVVQAVMAFVAAIAALWKTAALDLNAVWSALSLVGARCGQLYSSMQAERSQMIQDMVNILYDKTNDAQEGVVSMLLEDMAEQQLKEAVLAYTLLYMNIEDELSRDKLDELCEDFLEQHFALKVDFAVEDALPRLVEWGLVKENPKTGRFQAVNVEAAHKQLVKRWVVAYEALSKPPAMKTLPMTALLPGGERQMIEAWSGQNLAAPGGSFVAKAAPAGSGPATSAAVTQPVTAARGGKEVPAASSASTASAAELQSGPSFKSKPSIMGDRPSPAHTTPLESVPESPPSVTSKQVANSRGSPGVSTGSTAAAPKAKRGLTAFFRSRSKGSKAMDASSPTRTA